jgi:sugar diacid utilization regulator
MPDVIALTRPARLSERDRILNALTANVDALADAATRQMPVEIPAYRGRDEQFFTDVRDQLGRHYRTKLQALRGDRPVTRADLAFANPCALRRARAGLALEDYLHAFRVGQQVFWSAVLKEAGSSLEGREAALQLATPVMRYNDMAATHASRAFVEYQQHLVADADRERRDLLEHLLLGELPAHRPLATTAQAHGLAATTPAVVAVAVAGGSNPDAPHLAAARLAQIGGRAGRALVVSRQSELVVVAALAPGDQAADATAVCQRLEDVQQRLAPAGVQLAVGVGTVAEGVADLPRAYQEATAALEGVPADGGVVALPRLSPFDYLALRADETARRLVDARLRTFLAEDEERGGPLVETAQAFADADLNLRVAAERLRVHPNTAQYRLRRIEERTGRNPRHIADLVDLLTAIALAKTR